MAGRHGSESNHLSFILGSANIPGSLQLILKSPLAGRGEREGDRDSPVVEKGSLEAGWRLTE